MTLEVSEMDNYRINCSLAYKYGDGSTIFVATKTKKLLDMYGIRSLLLLSLGAQTILTIFGNRRRYRLRYLTRFFLWLSYLTASPVVTLALGKLLGINAEAFDVKGNQLVRSEFFDEYLYYAVWFAPFLLLQIGSPNVISYSVEDNKLKFRQLIGLTTQVAISLWIFFRLLGYWFDISSILLYVAGIVKVAERLRALWSISITENVVIASFAKNDIRREETSLESSSFSNYSHDLFLLVKAYQRFDRLKPYLENWLGHPSSVYLSSMSVEDCPPKDVFRITEFELSFMYDVLYTKASISYSNKKLWGRIIFFLALALLLVILTIFLFVGSDFPGVDDIILLLCLLGVTVLEIYEMKEFLFSDWVVLQMRKQNRSTFISRSISRIVPKIPRKNHRWSHCIDQFNLLSYCLYEDTTKLGGLIRRIFKVKGYYKEYKKYCVKKDNPVPEELKKLILEQILEVRAQRGWQSFSKRGEGALERCNCLQDLEWSIQTDFDTPAKKQTNFGKAIIIWHIATTVCYYLDDGASESTLNHPLCEMSKLLSDYMTYLLGMIPDMLSIVTGDLLFQGACAQVDEFFKAKQSKDEATLCGNLLVETCFQGIPNNNVFTSDWNVLLQVQKLAKILQERDDKWSIISSVWVEMLFYAAINCPWTLHAEQLRKGGELLTHIWLLLEHEKDQPHDLSLEL
ncbi:uncharacterized protein LOC123194931 [Mangifera indica]|uniref:uncharacterized protein LOC123194931 n=1 Tax=Mangifera indica TaxID=29780 RepID=UPI001CFAAEF7|nr:uncharacterized protein LOC123194931 [Mangifera indica]